MKKLLPNQNGQDTFQNTPSKCSQCKEEKDTTDKGICLDCYVENMRKARLEKRYDIIRDKIPKYFKDAAKYYPNTKLESVLYFGTAGRGKTTKAFSQIYNNLEKIKSFEYIKINRLLNKLNPAISNDILEIAAKYEQVDVLLLDDLSIQNFSDASIRYLFMILDYRMEHIKTTIITSLDSPNDLIDKLPEEVMSRLNELCRFEEKKGDSHRW